MIDQEKIHNLCLSEDPKELEEALKQLKENFSLLPDEHQAWDDLIKLIYDRNLSLSHDASDAIINVFFEVPDQSQAWNDIILLTNDESCTVRISAVKILGSLFSDLLYKQEAWDNLIKLANVSDCYEASRNAAYYLNSAFSYVPDKQCAWNDLVALMKNSSIRDAMEYVADTLLLAYSQVPDKQQAWNDLHSLTDDPSILVREMVTNILVSIFSDIPDKQQAWDDVQRLACDKDSYQRPWAVDSLFILFPRVPDKKKAWDDLIKLSKDPEMDVRAYANHSLGKISILKASQSLSEEDYRRELESAIEFFEKAAMESSKSWLNPSKFCLPFYRSFHTIIFERQETKEEVNKYLEDAKSAIEGSKSKELLFEAVENLANALKQVQNLGNLDLDAKKSELIFYRTYFDRAAELMIDAEVTAPFATLTLRKGLPILDRNLKLLIEEIQEKAKIACKELKGTDAEEIACTINKEVQKWEIGNQEEMSWYVPNIVLLLKSKIPHTLENEEILDMIESMKYEKDLTKQYRTLSSVIGLIPTVNVVPTEQVIEKIESSQREILEEIRKNGEKLDDVVVYVKPGVREELILHIGAISSVGGGVEYTLTVPLQGLSYPEVKEDLKEISGKRISQLSMLPKKIAKIVKEYLTENKMEDLLSKLC